MNLRKRLLQLGFVFCLMFCLISTAVAADFSVSIPRSLAIRITSDGTVEVPTGKAARIYNNSSTAVKVTSLVIEKKGDWNLVSWNSTPTSGENEVAMKILGLPVQEDGSVSIATDIVIQPNSYKDLDVQVKFPTSMTKRENELVASLKCRVDLVGPAPVESSITNDWDADLFVVGGTKDVTFSYSGDDSVEITSVVADDTDVVKLTKANTRSVSAEDTYAVTGLKRGVTSVTATLSTGKTTSFNVAVAETGSTSDINASTGDKEYNKGDSPAVGDITVTLPITNADGSTNDYDVPVSDMTIDSVDTSTGKVTCTVDVGGKKITFTFTISYGQGITPVPGVTVTPQEATAAGWTYEPYGEEMMITGFSNTAFKRDIQVPSHIGDFAIVKISNNVFKDQTNLRTIEVPDTVTEIGASAFENCSALTSMVINNVTEIGANAYKGCTKLEEITAGSAENIGDSAFEACSALVDIPLHEGLKTIGDKAFAECSKLTDDIVKLPSTVTQMGALAFMNTSLSTVVNLQSTESAKFILFAENSIQVPIDTPANIIVPSGVSSECEAYIGDEWYYPESTPMKDSDDILQNNDVIYCDTRFVFPEKHYTTEEAEAAGFTFAGRGSNPGISIKGYDVSKGGKFMIIPATINGEDVTDVWYESCRNRSIQGVYFPSTVYRLGTRVFENCRSLCDARWQDDTCVINPTEQTVNNNGEYVRSQIGSDAFTGCNLTELRVPKGMEVLGDYVCKSGNKRFKAMYLPSSLVILGYRWVDNDVDFDESDIFYEGTRDELAPYSKKTYIKASSTNPIDLDLVNYNAY